MNRVSHAREACRHKDLQHLLGMEQRQNLTGACLLIYIPPAFFYAATVCMHCYYEINEKL